MFEYFNADPILVVRAGMLIAELRRNEAISPPMVQPTSVTLRRLQDDARPALRFQFTMRDMPGLLVTFDLTLDQVDFYETQVATLRRFLARFE